VRSSGVSSVGPLNPIILLGTCVRVYVSVCAVCVCVEGGGTLESKNLVGNLCMCVYVGVRSVDACVGGGGLQIRSSC